MRVIKGTSSIASVAEWEIKAGPKLAGQWTDGRSAKELARAWFRTGSCEMPREFRELLDSRPETRALEVDEVYPECRIRFDRRRGEPRNADLALVGESALGRVAVTVEAKADESFGPTVSEALAAAEKRRLRKSSSKGVDRIEDLVASILPALAIPQDLTSSVGSLRYQLLTAVAGTLALAVREHAKVAVMVVHEFVTDQTSDARHLANAGDFRAFLERVGAPMSSGASALHGPVSIPGPPLFTPTMELFVGKVSTELRSVGTRQ